MDLITIFNFLEIRNHNFFKNNEDFESFACIQSVGSNPYFI